MRVITIGRDAANDVVVDDAHASRHHLQIILHDDGHYTLADFGSTNGTFVNGQQISGEIPIEPNDIVRIGNTTIPWRQYFEEPENTTPQPTNANPGSIAVQTLNIGNKERHGFITFCLVIMIIVNFISAIFNCINADVFMWAYASEEKAQTFFYVDHAKTDYYYYGAYAMSALGVVNLIGAILLLSWKKAGYWLFLSSTVCVMAIMVLFGFTGDFTSSVLSSMLGAVIGPVILWAILQIRKNRISCWKQLV